MSSIKPEWKNNQEITLEEYFKLRFTDTAKYVKLLIEQLGEEKAYQILDQNALEEGIEIGKEFMIYRNPLTSKDDLVCFWKDVYSDPFWGSCLELQYADESGDCFKVNVTKCIWAHTFSKLGATDLGFHTMCMGDYGIAEGISPHVTLKRSKTLMQGDDHCDFAWCWEDS